MEKIDCPNCDIEYDGAPDGYGVTVIFCNLHEAALELLAALKFVVAASTECDEARMNALAAARAVIDKAEGKAVAR